jgi:hypothetical protein
MIVLRLILSILLFSFFWSCEAPDPKLEKNLRRKADSTFNQRTGPISERMDSLCDVRFDSLVQNAFDSIIEVRTKKIEKLSKRGR